MLNFFVLKDDGVEDSMVSTTTCRTPTLAKCGGEVQHLEKLGFEVLQDS
jgi:hypothetical protein